MHQHHTSLFSVHIAEVSSQNSIAVLHLAGVASVSVAFRRGFQSSLAAQKMGEGFCPFFASQNSKIILKRHGNAYYKARLCCTALTPTPGFDKMFLRSKLQICFSFDRLGFCSTLSQAPFFSSGRSRDVATLTNRIQYASEQSRNRSYDHEPLLSRPLWGELGIEPLILRKQY